MTKTPETCLNNIREKLNQFLMAASKAPANVIRDNDPKLYLAITTLSKSLSKHSKAKEGLQNKYGFRHKVEPSPKLLMFQASLKRIGSGKLSAKERESELCNVIGMIPEVVAEQTDASLANAVEKMSGRMSAIGNSIRRCHVAGTSDAKPSRRTPEEREILDKIKNLYLDAKAENPKPNVKGICDGVYRKLKNSPFESAAQLLNAFKYDLPNVYGIVD